MKMIDQDKAQEILIQRQKQRKRNADEWKARGIANPDVTLFDVAKRPVNLGLRTFLDRYSDVVYLSRGPSQGPSK